MPLPSDGKDSLDQIVLIGVWFTLVKCFLWCCFSLCAVRFFSFPLTFYWLLELFFQANLADFSGNQWVTCFQDSAEAILNTSASQIGQMKDSVRIMLCNRSRERLNCAPRNNVSITKCTNMIGCLQPLFMA